MYFKGQQLSYEVVFDDQDLIKNSQPIQNEPKTVSE